MVMFNLLQSFYFLHKIYSIVLEKIKESKYDRMINIKLLYCFSSYTNEKPQKELNRDANN